VYDAIGALMGLIQHPKAVGEVYNIGSDTEVTITELAERIKLLTGSRSRIVYVPYNEAYEEGFEDMMRRVPDTTKIRNLIGYEPKIELDQILESVIAFQESKLASEAGAPMHHHGTESGHAP
jgi:UDP-glucose 4-epimerase